ncbi:3-hydroxyacyl-CoA dehydrogenase NAD-binding domain-containing protein [Marinobacterium rhizophilum]|uniref:enoyl-CoA hydratase n=1 Tax=Marinobacterium rhizophilum TaxID=420402 RepID=A0ABY5HKT5_9GAMM|nr:3-hydroxyacyl-CoA dehydrogenase NAD-binding domain-containing protein [Marinobacterium rhizophilum]UTW12412.1 enoyl-CoA hydratase/isomerase family protein [Marinobacterium rhizophilum]
MNAIRYEKDNAGIVTLTIDMPGQAVNTMSPAFAEALEEAVSQLENDDIRGVIVTSGKDTFFAGGDLHYLLGIDESQVESFYDNLTRNKQRLRRLEQLGVPVVAAINGTALGGGLEICLACHYRVVLDKPKSVLGLPEVSLGLLPGAGGVTRLTRMLGIDGALPLLLEGTKLKPAQAHEAGLVDELAATGDDMLARARAWIGASPEALQPWDREGHAIPGGSAADPRIAQTLAFRSAKLRGRHRGLTPAPEAILAATIEGSQVDFDTALRIESRYLTSLVTSPVAKNLINHFFQLNQINGGASRPQGIERAAFNKVGILGAGMMGAGIAYAAAKAGIEVVLKDVSQQGAEKGKAYSTRVMDGLITKGRATDEKKAALLALIQPTDNAEDLAGCDLIIEAVFENVELKARVTAQAEPQLIDTGIFASNTSTLPITGLAKASARPENFIGLHFFSPVDRMPLVEIICGKQTSDETLARSFDFVQQIGKVPIVVNDSMGFFTSRVFRTFMDEGCALLEDGVDPLVIESLARAAGMPVGPLTAQDQVSLKLAYDVRTANRKLVVAEGGEWKVLATERVGNRLVEEFNRQGRAYGGGFYDYHDDGSKSIWPQLCEIFPQSDQPLPEQDIKDRILFRQALEAVRCLEEKVLRSVADGNIGSIMGIGFPQHTGGQLQFINSYGVRAFTQRCLALAQKYGERFTPPALLLAKAEKGETFA